MYFPVGLGTMAIAAGISAVRHGGLPTWLGWAGIVAGALFFTPGFFIALILVPLWILVVSIMGIMGSRSSGEAPAAA